MFFIFTSGELDMLKLTTAVRNFIREEDGAALVEYAILVALIAVVAIFFVTSLGTKVSEKFSGIAGSL
jgi:pilus assembly protein Flp/PilA